MYAIRSYYVIDALFAALVFKVMIEEGRRTVYLRVYSGKLSEGDVVGNASTGETEKVARLFRIHAGKKGRIKEAVAGDIVAIRGIRNARTGDTLVITSYSIHYTKLYELKRWPLVCLLWLHG